MRTIEHFQQLENLVKELNYNPDKNKVLAYIHVNGFKLNNEYSYYSISSKHITAELKIYLYDNEVKLVAIYKDLDLYDRQNLSFGRCDNIVENIEFFFTNFINAAMDLVKN